MTVITVWYLVLMSMNATGVTAMVSIPQKDYATCMTHVAHANESKTLTATCVEGVITAPLAPTPR